MSATWIDKDEDRTIAKWKCSLPADCPVEIVGKPKIVYRGQWTRTVEVHYRKRNSKKEEVSQSIHRKEISPGRAHGVEVIAILHKAGKRYFVFVKEYRIPPAGYCFEFPAGLLEEGETVIDAARRELKEETGYTASKVICLSEERHPMAPQLTDNSISYAIAEINGDSLENQNPKMHLDEAEIIEVVEVECNKALAYVQSISTKVNVDGMVVEIECNKALAYVQSISNKVNVDGMVYAFLLGYNAKF
uniref:Nudix hydrolase domain-containing protein n=1 Tax=Ascaris lumbricoides TaxID=6252 RepID=A0A0M3IK80_ASCLU